MRHFQTYDGHAYFSARDGTTQSACNLFGEELQSSELVIVDVEDLVDFAFWNYQYVSRLNGVYVKESEIAVGFRHFVGGDFACCNS